MKSNSNRLIRAAYFHTATQEEIDQLAYLDSILTTEDKQGLFASALQNVDNKSPFLVEKNVFTFNPDTKEVELGKITTYSAPTHLVDTSSQREKDRDWQLEELQLEYERLKKNLTTGIGQFQEQDNLPRTQEELDRWYANQKQVIEDSYSMERLAIPTAEEMDAFQKQWDNWTPDERNKNAILYNAILAGNKFNSKWKGILGGDYAENLYIDSLRNYYMMLYARSGGKSMEPNLLDTVMQGVFSTLPEIGLSLMTAGMSPLPSTESLMAYGPDMYNAYNTIARSMQSVVQDPKFIPSFAVQSSLSYKEAIEKNPNEFEAAAYAWLNGFFGAAADINGVFQADDTVKKDLMEFVKELGQSGGDEAVKGLTSKLNAMLTYDQDKKIFSFTDSDALINPKDMAGDALTGMAVKGIETGSSTTLSTAVTDLRQYVQASADNGLIS